MIRMFELHETWLCVRSLFYDVGSLQAKRQEKGAQTENSDDILISIE